jgi:hypothetical protein
VVVSLPSVFVITPIAVIGLFEVARRRRAGPILAYAGFLAAAGGGVAVLAALGRYQLSPGDRACYLAFWAEGFPPSWRDPAALAGWLVRTHTGPMFAYPHGPIRVLAWLNAVVLACFLVGVVRRGRRDPGGAALLVLPFVSTFAASVLRRYPYGTSPRVVQFLVPSTLILAAAGAEWLLARVRPLPLRRWAVPGLVGALVALGLWRFANDLSRPYRAPWDRTGREFARWFWEEQSAVAEMVCVRTDLGIAFRPEPWSYDGADAYLCYQRIYSARHREGLPPRWDAVSTARPLRCVLLNRTPDQVPAFRAWLTANRQRFALRDVRAYPAARAALPEPSLTYVVCELVPTPAPLAAGAAVGVARRGGGPTDSEQQRPRPR